MQNIILQTARYTGFFCLLFVWLRPCAQPSVDSLRHLLESKNIPDRQRSDLLRELAWELKKSDPKSAGILADSSLLIAQRLQYEYGIGEAMHAKGMIYWYLNEYEEAVILFFKSLEIRQKLKDSLGIARSFNNIGNVYFLQENYDYAETYYRNGLQLREALRDTAGLIYSYNNLADVMLRRNELNTAEEMYLAALKLASDNLDGQAFIHSNLGKLRKKQDMRGKALQHFLTSKKLSEKTGNLHILEPVLIQIARLNLENKEFSLAITNATAALAINQSSGSEANASEAALLLAKSQAAMGAFEKAYQYQQLYSEINERLLKKNTQNSITEIQARHELEAVKSEAEKSLLQKQKQIGSLIIFSLTCVFLVALSFLFFWISRYRTQINTARLLEEKNRAIQQQNEALLQSNIALEQYVFVASHDLKEPLRTVGAFASLLRRRYKDYLDEDGLTFIQNISKGVEQMSVLTEDLLTFAKTGRESESQKSLVNLSALVDKVLSNLNARLTECNAQIEKADMPSVYINPAHALQLFQNLISNALKFSDKEQCIIRLHCEKKADHFLFSVSDNGMGIPDEWQNDIFLPFRRLDHKGRSGAGLGLAICDKIVRLYGGTIWVESEPGRGSNFYFTLPIIKPTH